MNRIQQCWLLLFAG